MIKKEEISVYCPYCKESEEQYRVFKVAKDTYQTFCPNCGALVDVTQGHKLFNYRISTLLKKAKNRLEVYNDYQTAYKEYGYILQLDKNNLEAHFGRLLSLLRLSTLRKTKFAEVFSLLKVEHKVWFSKANDLNQYYEFLSTVFTNLQSYIAIAYKRLTVKNYYYDSDCASLMVIRTNEVKESLKSLLVYMKFVDDKINSLETNKKVEMISKAILDKDAFLKKEFILIDGAVLNYLSNAKNKENPIFTTNKEHAQINVVYYKPYSLEPENWKVLKINDQIFRSKKIVNKLKKISLALAIFSLTISFIMFILMWFIDEIVLTSIILESVFFALAITFFVLFIYSKKELNHKH